PVASAPAAEPAPDWTAQLDEALGAAGATRERRLLLCPATRQTRVTSLLLGLAEWALERGAGSVLAIEANFAHPRLAKALHIRSRGLDRLNDGPGGAPPDAVQPTAVEGLSA